MRPLAFLLLLPAAAFPDEALKAFHERFDKENSPAKRREAVLALKGHPGANVVSELSALLPKRRSKEDDPTVEAICEVLASFDTAAAAEPVLSLALKPKAPRKDVLYAREALKGCRSPSVMKSVCERGLAVKDPLILEAMADVLGAAGYGPAAARLKPLLAHKEARVRAAAAEAYGRVAEPKGAAALRALLSCGDPIVADSALAGLAWMRDEESWGAVLKGLETGSRQVRCGLARALGARKDDEKALQALIGAMARERGRLVPVLAASLEQASGQKLGTDPRAWAGWWAARNGQAPAVEVDTKPVKSPEYFDVPFFCDRVAFVCDVSGSMCFGNPGAKMLKIERSKEALCKAVATLGGHVSFNIVPYSYDAIPWQKGYVPATPENQAKAQKFIRDLRADGGTSTRVALRCCMGDLTDLGPKGGFSRGYAPDQPDTLFLLTDGIPNVTWDTEDEDGPNKLNRPDDSYDILAEITFANRFQDTQIYTLGMTGDAKANDDIDPVALELLARWNSGTYTFLK